LEQVSKAYYDGIARGCLHPEVNAATPLRFVYTPMHGVGQNYMKRAFQVAQFRVRTPYYLLHINGYRLSEMAEKQLKTDYVSSFSFQAVHFCGRAEGC
jgi:hypothetical protein